MAKQQLTPAQRARQRIQVAARRESERAAAAAAKREERKEQERYVKTLIGMPTPPDELYRLITVPRVAVPGERIEDALAEGRITRQHKLVFENLVTCLRNSQAAYEDLFDAARRNVCYTDEGIELPDPRFLIIWQDLDHPHLFSPTEKLCMSISGMGRPVAAAWQILKEREEMGDALHAPGQKLSAQEMARNAEAALRDLGLEMGVGWLNPKKINLFEEERKLWNARASTARALLQGKMKTLSAAAGFRRAREHEIKEMYRMVTATKNTLVIFRNRLCEQYGLVPGDRINEDGTIDRGWRARTQAQAMAAYLQEPAPLDPFLDLEREPVREAEPVGVRR